jgi:hypothetical protein
MSQSIAHPVTSDHDYYLALPWPLPSFAPIHKASDGQQTILHNTSSWKIFTAAGTRPDDAELRNAICSPPDSRPEEEMHDLTGPVVPVTGGALGIGSAYLVTCSSTYRMEEQC